MVTDDSGVSLNEVCTAAVDTDISSDVDDVGSRNFGISIMERMEFQSMEKMCGAMAVSNRVNIPTLFKVPKLNQLRN